MAPRNCTESFSSFNILNFLQQTAERSPAKAGIGGSIPSLATCFQSLTGLPNGDLVPIGPKTLTQTSLGLVSRAFHFVGELTVGGYDLNGTAISSQLCCKSMHFVA